MFVVSQSRQNTDPYSWLYPIGHCQGIAWAMAWPVLNARPRKSMVPLEGASWALVLGHGSAVFFDAEEGEAAVLRRMGVQRL
jgi:hypothetical protein